MFTMCPLLLLVFPPFVDTNLDTMVISPCSENHVAAPSGLRRETDVAYEQELQQNPYSVRRAELMIADGIWGPFFALQETIGNHRKMVV